MAANTRNVTTLQRFPDGSPRVGGIVAYTLSRESYTATESYPTGTIYAVCGADGVATASLWTNAEGLKPTRYDFVLPDGNTGSFVLPTGTTAITLEALRIAAGIGTWAPLTVTTLLDELRAELANTADPVLGDAMIGMRQAVTGAVARTVHDKLGESLSVRDFGATGDGVTDDRAAIQLTIDAAIASTTATAVEFPPGDYVVKSTVGVGREIVSLLALEADGLTIRSAQNAQILLQDGCSVRPIMFRTCTRLTVEGMTVIDQRTAAVVGGVTQPRLGNGMSFENCSQVQVRGNWVENCGTYGYALSEDTSKALIQASTISFDAATQQIRDSANGLLGFIVGDRLYSVNTVRNNGFATVAATSGDGASITITQVEAGDLVIVDETAGLSGDVLLDTTISFSGSTMSTIDGSFLFLDENDTFVVAGSTLGDNDLTYKVVTVTDDGKSLTVTGVFTDHGAGPLISITRVGKALVQVWLALACDDVTFVGNTALDCGVYGFELFPKALSKNLRVYDNTADGCGLINTAGCGIKGGTNVINAYLVGNTITGCQFGMNLGNFRATVVLGNHITNCQKYGLAITMSSHAKAPLTEYGTLVVKHNLIAYTNDPETGDLFVPTAANRAAININGLIADIGLLEIAYNTIFKWGNGGIKFDKSHVSYTNVKLHHNTLIDSGGLLVQPLEDYTATTVNGSPTLSSIVRVGSAVGTTQTAGWLAGVEVVGAGIPAGTTIISKNIAANTMTMSANATASASSVALRSGIPLDMEVSDNTFVSTAASSTNIVRVWSNGAKVVANKIKGFGQYPLQVMGSQAWVKRNQIEEPNRLPSSPGTALYLGTAMDATGIYYLYDNELIVTSTTQINYMMTSTYAGTVYADRNRSSLEAVTFTNSGGVAPSPLAIFEGNRRTRVDIAPPSSGTWSAGDEVRNALPTVLKPIHLWRCIVSGSTSAANWICVAGIGKGTAAQRAALVMTASENGMMFEETDTNKLVYYRSASSGWRLVATLTTAA